ncbi:MAG: hypothetical protein BWX92_04071 [Deltaproteobacteria bacterium ADurb.Bin135]|nr:MAG: hypothetical protein BWX92_04080 [Deltaproteobacteria bacterium ADurb.Bin135]OQB66685.1 MAG: hypothetical protein BWX92_04071 [Deltaproteobacteria bacterium ADurb.Bin135]
MVAYPPRLFWVVSFLCTLLLTIACYNSRVYIEGIVVEVYLIKEPLKQGGEYLVILRLTELLEVPLECLVSCHPLPAEHLLNYLVVSCYL